MATRLPLPTLLNIYLNPSFTGGITNWTLSTTTYDPAVFQDTAGSILTSPGTGRNNEVTGTATQTISTSINSTDTVNLSLYWRKSYVTEISTTQRIEAQIEKPSEPGVWTTIWSDTQIGDFAWTSVGPIDVSSYFDEIGTYGFRFYMNPRNGNNTAAETYLWVDNTHLDVTSVAEPNITVNPTIYDFLAVEESSTPSTSTTYFAIDNNSTMQTDQTIGVTTSTWEGGIPWDHAEDAVPGPDLAGLKANRGGTWGTGDIIVKYSSPNYIYENCPATTDYSFGLQLLAPTSFSDGAEKQIIVRITAMAG